MRKYLTGMIMAVFTLILALPFSAQASEQEAIYLEADGDSVKVRLSLPGADGAMFSSLKLTLNVASDSAENLDASFQFDPSLSGKAKVQEARYQAEKDTLNVYIAGRDALFEKGEDTITLGKVCASDKAFTVEVKEDCLTVAEGSKGRTVKLERLPQPVLAGGASSSGNEGGMPSSPNPGGSGEETAPPSSENGGGTPPSSNPGNNGGETVPPSSGNGNGGMSIPSDTDAGENQSSSGFGNDGEILPPADGEQLQKSVNAAKEYPKSAYTKKSYAALEEARKNAEGIQNNPNATKEEREKALQSLQNAVGALEEKTFTSAEEKSRQSTGTEREGTIEDSVPVVLYVIIVLFVLVIAGITAYGIMFKNKVKSE